MKLLLPLLPAMALAGDVLNLGAGDFSPTIDSSDLALVKFFAPWCGHCKKMAPDFEKAATSLKNNDPPVVLAEVDCTVEQGICQEHGVSGYPTLKVFRNGVASDYSGGRTAADMVKMMAGQAGPASMEMTDADKLQKYLESKTNVVLGFFESEKSEGVDAFKKAAQELRETVKFAHSFDAAVAKAAGQEAGSVVLFRPKTMKSKFEEQQEKYNKDKFTVGLIRNWVKEVAAGLCPIIEPGEQGELGFPLVITMYNVDYVRNPKGTQYWRNRVMKVAQNYGDVKFAIGDSNIWDGMLGEMGVDADENDSPVVVAFGSPDAKYVMKDTFDPKGEALTKFLDDFKAGTLQRHVKSEEEPSEQTANKVLTANNFDSFVDGSKDAFIEFYAPWCGHCKSLAPKWDEMAEKFSDNDNVVIGKMDATANDVPSQFEVQGFPTLFWVPKGKLGSPVKYQGGRETKDLIDYVSKHTSAKDEL